MGTFAIRGTAKERGVGNIDSRLVDIIRQTAENSPYDVELFSGKRYGGGKSRHDRGQAVDIVLSLGGQQIPNLGSKPGFNHYETFAKTAKNIQQATYPDLNDQFRWGGYFGPSSLNKDGFDLMHFDLRPGAPMALGSFETGLNARGQAALANLGAGKIYSAAGIVSAGPEEGYASLFGRGRLTPPAPVGRNIARLPKADVKQIQATLQQAGYNVTVDGIAGPQTKAALADYQQQINSAVASVGMEPDAPGFVGPATQAALDILRERQAAVPNPVANPLSVERPNFDMAVPTPRANPLSATRPNFDVTTPTPRPNPNQVAAAPVPRMRPDVAQITGSVQAPQRDPLAEALISMRSAQPARSAMPGLSMMDDAPGTAANVLTQDQRNNLSVDLAKMAKNAEQMDMLRQAASMPRSAITDGSLGPDIALDEFSNPPSFAGGPTAPSYAEKRTAFGQDFAMDQLRAMEMAGIRTKNAQEAIDDRIAYQQAAEMQLELDKQRATRELVRQLTGVDPGSMPVAAGTGGGVFSAGSAAVRDPQRAMRDAFDLSGALNFSEVSPRQNVGALQRAATQRAALSPRSYSNTEVSNITSADRAANARQNTLARAAASGNYYSAPERTALQTATERAAAQRAALSPRSYSNTEIYNTGLSAQADTARQNALASAYSRGAPVASASPAPTSSYSAGAKASASPAVATPSNQPAAPYTAPADWGAGVISASGGIPSLSDLAAYGASLAANAPVPTQMPAIPPSAIPTMPTMPAVPAPVAPAAVSSVSARPMPAVSAPRLTGFAAMEAASRSRLGPGAFTSSRPPSGRYTGMTRSANGRIAEYTDSRGTTHRTTSFGQYADPKAGNGYYSRTRSSSSGGDSGGGGSSSRTSSSRTSSGSRSGSSGNSSIDKARNPSRGGFGD